MRCIDGAGYMMVDAPPDYPGKKYIGERYCLEHRLIWWQNTGEAPEPDEIIHHRNGDPQDNRFSNLAKVDKETHFQIHSSVVYAVLCCPNCNVVFVREKRQTHLSKDTTLSFCSRSCSASFYHGIESSKEIKQAQEHNLLGCIISRPNLVHSLLAQ